MLLMGKLHSGAVHIGAKASHRLTFEVDLQSRTMDMVTAEALYNSQGAVILKENTPIDEQLAEKLKKLGIARIKMRYMHSSPTLADSVKNFEIQYIQNIIAFKALVLDLASGKKTDNARVDSIVESIFNLGESTSQILKNPTESYDEYLYTHSINVALLSMLTAKWLGFDGGKIRLLIKAALLHDIGKCKVEPDILNKPGKLSAQEIKKAKAHIAHGLSILKNISDLNRDVCMGIIMHHEREDGSGYPQGLKGNSIHEFAKIIAVADIYDAMTTNRVYKTKHSPFEVFEYLEQETGITLDLGITRCFLGNVSNYYVGDTFLLNTGELCKVIFINQKKISRPVIQIDDRYIDLYHARELRILSII